MTEAIAIIVFKRVLLALLLGAIIGYERELAHKVAGLRTHMLVCVSAALVSMVAIYGFTEMGTPSPESASRIIANILVGIGFIGGGAIIRNKSHISGTTTAATLWTVSIIGIAVGVGFAYAAIFVTLIAYIILTFLWHLEKKFEDGNHKTENDIININE